LLLKIKALEAELERLKRENAMLVQKLSQAEADLAKAQAELKKSGDLDSGTSSSSLYWCKRARFYCYVRKCTY
jgi:multidrug resistance efflux pump